MITRLALVGYDYTIGYLKGGFEAWKRSGKEIDTIESVNANELADAVKKGEAHIIDVRKESEYLSEHVDGATNLPLDNLNDSMAALDKNKTYYLHCAGGYRSMIFNSVLKARGFDNLIDISGGFKAIKENGQIKTTDFVCPTTLNKK